MELLRNDLEMVLEFVPLHQIHRTSSQGEYASLLTPEERFFQEAWRSELAPV